MEQWLGNVLRFRTDRGAPRRSRGLFIVLLGPDGAGKSTLAARLVQEVAPQFRGHEVFHWRPMLLFRPRQAAATTEPHGRPARSVVWSVLHLLLQLVDYWAGYWLRIRPLMGKSYLVVFDRYFYDLGVDPTRCRYGGPAWLVNAFQRLVPCPDHVFVLAASADAILARKSELSPEEVQRQLGQYRRLAVSLPIASILDGDRNIDEVVQEAVRELNASLARANAAADKQPFAVAAARSRGEE